MSTIEFWDEGPSVPVITFEELVQQLGSANVENLFLQKALRIERDARITAEAEVERLKALLKTAARRDGLRIEGGEG